MLTKIAIVFLVLLLIVLIIIGVTCFLLTRQPSIPPLPTTPVATAPVTVPGATLEQRIADFAREASRAKAAGEKKEMTLVIREDEANALIAAQLSKMTASGSPYQIKDTKVYFREGLLYVTVTADVSGITLTALAVAEVTVVDGKPKIVLKSLDMGRLPIPGLTEGITAMIRDQLDKVNVVNLPIRVTSIVIQGAEMRITGVTN